MASATIDTLTTRFEADVQKFGESMRKMTSSAKKASSDVQHEAEKAEGAFGNVGEALTKVFSNSRMAVFEEGGAKIGVFGSALEALGPAGLSAAAGIAAVAMSLESAHKAMEWADEVDRFSKTVGTSTENLQAFDQANIATSVGLKEGRGNLEEFSGIMAKFQAHLGDKKSAKWFDALGLSRGDFAGVTDNMDKLQIVLDKVAEMPNQSNRIGALNSLGLGQYKEVVAEGVEGVEKWKAAIKDAQASGSIVSDDDIHKAADLNDHLELMQYRAGNELKTAFLNLAPAVDGVATFLEKCSKWVATIIGQIPAAVAGITDMARQLIAATKIDFWPKLLGNVAASQEKKGQGVNDAAYGWLNNGQHPMLAKANDTANYILHRNIQDWVGDVWGKAVDRGHQVAPSTDPKNKPAARTPHTDPPATQFGHDKVAKGPKDRTDNIQATSDRDIAAAAKAELQARESITIDLDARAAIQYELLEQERKAALQKVDDDLKLKKITVAAATSIKTSINSTYDDKETLADRQNQAARLEAQRAYEDQIAKLQADELTSQASRAQTAAQWAALTRAAYDKQRATETGDFNDAVFKKVKAGTLTSAQGLATIAEHERDDATRDADETKRINDEVVARNRAFADAMIGYTTDSLQLEASMAKTATERNDIERQILDIRQKQARELLDEDIKKNPLNHPDPDAERGALAKNQAVQIANFADQHKNPFQTYVDGLKDVNTEIDNVKVDGFKSLEDGFVGLVDGTKTVSQAFSDMAKSIIDDIAKIIIEQTLLSALGLGGSGGGGGGLFGGFMSLLGLGGSGPAGGSGGLQPADLIANLPKAAMGTASAAGGATLIGEKGPEILNLPAGSRVTPTGLLGSMAVTATSPSQTIHAPVNVTVNAQGAFSAEWVQQQAHTAAYVGAQGAVKQVKQDMARDRNRSFR